MHTEAQNTDISFVNYGAFVDGNAFSYNDHSSFKNINIFYWLVPGQTFVKSKYAKNIFILGNLF
jgi:hypothetical protein